MEESSRQPKIAPRVRSWLLPLRIGLLIFLASMPLNVLNGHGKGMLADSDHFQGYEVVLLGFLFSLPVVDGNWFASAVFLSIATTSAFTLILPFLNPQGSRVWIGISRGLGAVSLLSLVLTTVFIVNWAINDGAFWGAIPWLGGPALVVMGALYRTDWRMQFSVKQALVSIAAIAALLSQWPPYFISSEGLSFNENFGKVVAIEVFLSVVVVLTKRADSARRELESPPADSDPSP